jgi:hypothetical protein
MREVVANRSIREAADEFIKLAIERGAPDNVTVIVARVGTEEEAGEDTELDRTDPSRRATAKIPAFDDTTPLAPIESETPAQSDVEIKEPEAPPPPASVDVARDGYDTGPVDASQIDTLEVPAPDKGGHPILKWMLIVVLALSAAGAWLLWHNQHRGSATPPSSSTSH